MGSPVEWMDEIMAAARELSKAYAAETVAGERQAALRVINAINTYDAGVEAMVSAMQEPACSCGLAHDPGNQECPRWW